MKTYILAIPLLLPTSTFPTISNIDKRYYCCAYTDTTIRYYSMVDADNKHPSSENKQPRHQVSYACQAIA